MAVDAQWLLPPYFEFQQQAAVTTPSCAKTPQSFVQLSSLAAYSSAFLRQADGGRIVAGRFDAVRAYPQGEWAARNGVARYQSDGSLDTRWNADVRCDGSTHSGFVRALVTDSAGNVYIAGAFTSLGDTPRRNLARLKPNGDVDATWQADVEGEVFALAMDAQDRLFVGGAFSRIGGVDRGHLAKIVNGTVDTNWKPVASVPVGALLADDTGSLYVGGISYQLAPGVPGLLAKFSREGSGTTDPRWTIAMPDSSAITTMTVDTQGWLYVGGYFSRIGNEPRSSIARVSLSDASVDPSWMHQVTDGFPDKNQCLIGIPHPSGPIPVQSMAVAGDGAVFG